MVCLSSCVLADGITIILFYFISFCLFNYTLVLWVIMVLGYVVYLTSYVVVDGIANLFILC